jgi:alkanesulfonate monooxygenase
MFDGALNEYGTEMPIEITGIISHHFSNEETVLPPKVFDRDVLRAHAVAHEQAGFDRVLVAQSSFWPDSMPLASYLAGVTERLGFMVAHRPGFVAPTMAARQFATLDHVSQGRAAIHIITAANDRETQCDGDFFTKEERYHRSREFVEILRRMWATKEPVSHDGRFYKFNESLPEIGPYERSSIPVYWAGGSPVAVQYAGECADTYAVGMESLANTKLLIDKIKASAATAGRDIGVQGTVRYILGRTEAEAWDNAREVLRKFLANGEERLKLTGNSWFQPGGRTEAEFSNAAGISNKDRFGALTGSDSVLDDCLWVAPQREGIPMSPSLVGTPEQVANAIMRYYDMGMTGVLFRGFDLLGDAVEAGKELIPRLKVAAFDRDAQLARSLHNDV